MNLSSKQVRFTEAPKVLQQINTNKSSSRFNTAVQELRNSFNEKTRQLSNSRVSEQLNESTATIAKGYCQPQCLPQCQPQCVPQWQPQPQAYLVQSQNQTPNNDKLEKKIKKLKKELKKTKEEQQIQTIQSTPKREKQVILQKDPEIDHIKREIQEMERIIKQLELQPKGQSSNELEINLEDNKKNAKKLCKKIKALEKELYEVARQRDEALIIKAQLERENQEMFDRIGELESVLKIADKKVFDLTVQYERQCGYVKQLEDEVERLRRKKKKNKPQPQPEYRHPEPSVSVVEKPYEVIKTVEKIVEVPREVIKEVPREVIKEKIVEVPRIEYVYQQVPQYIEKIVEIPVERIVEVPVPRIVEVQVDRPVYQDRIREVPVERIVEVPVPYEVYIDVPYEVIKEVRVPYEVIKEVQVPYEVYRDVPYEVIKEVQVPYEVVIEKIVEVPKYIEVPYQQRIEVPVEVPVQYPVDRVVEVPVEYERIVEVPVDRWHRDDREIQKLNDENVHLQQELQYLRDRLRSEIQNGQISEDQQINYMRDQIHSFEIQLRNVQNERFTWEERSIKLEEKLIQERQIVSDLQNRLDQMYYQVELLTSENNKKNEDFARYLEKLEKRHQREIHRASQPNVVQHYLVDTGAEGIVQL
ncbi:hypothetical protein pb186bvf_013399 [Paramecium bursaria]